MKAVLYDSLAYIEGRLGDFDQDGADFFAIAHPDSPELPKKTNIMINLLDEQTGRSMNVQARLMAIQRSGKDWIYRVRWLGVPAVLKSA